MTETTITSADAAARLAGELPQWQVADGTLQRTYRTSGWKSTLILASTIGHLAEAAWHHPDLHLTYDSVRVNLSTHSANGLTEKDFVLAAKIEETVLWQPAWGGPPTKHQHIK